MKTAVIIAASGVGKRMKLDGGLSKQIEYIIKALGDGVHIVQARYDDETRQRFGVVSKLECQVDMKPWPSGALPALPEPLSSIHSAQDTSSRLSEDSLRLMLSIVVALVRAYNP